MSSSRATVAALLTALALAAGGCQSGAAPTSAEPAQEPKPAAAKKAAPLPVPPCQGGDAALAKAKAAEPGVAVPKGAVASVVFVDQEEACPCTSNRIQASWAALQSAVTGSGLSVERIHADTQELDAESYRAMKPIMVMPAVYLLDAKGGLVKQMQGELNADELRAALGTQKG